MQKMLHNKTLEESNKILIQSSYHTHLLSESLWDELLSSKTTQIIRIQYLALFAMQDHLEANKELLRVLSSNQALLFYYWKRCS